MVKEALAIAAVFYLPFDEAVLAVNVLWFGSAFLIFGIMPDWAMDWLARAHVHPHAFGARGQGTAHVMPSRGCCGAAVLRCCLHWQPRLAGRLAPRFAGLWCVRLRCFDGPWRCCLRVWTHR